MNDVTNEFWDYTKQEPIVESALKYLTRGNALDLDAGEGRDAGYLAEKGFVVTAVETESSSVAKLRRKDFKITVIESDILAYQPQEQFDLIVCDMVLHFLQPSQVTEMIKKIQDWTRHGGHNVLKVYTDKNPKGKRPYLFATNELKDYYSKWQCLDYIEKPTPWFQMKGEDTPRRNHAAYLIAKKP
jgi:2-polyprenyl-3-methyl-5-hydroxy-6-metoxy-1,4-benzoquinol methylase